MKITHFETFLCSYTFPEDKAWWGQASWERDAKGVRFNAVIVRVHTDEGLTGLGEASGWGDCRDAEAAIHQLEPRFIGRDPFDVEKLTVHTADRRLNSALAPIDCALWDIIGKATQTPVFRLLARTEASRWRNKNYSLLTTEDQYAIMCIEKRFSSEVSASLA